VRHHHDLAAADPGQYGPQRVQNPDAHALQTLSALRRPLLEARRIIPGIAQHQPPHFLIRLPFQTPEIPLMNPRNHPGVQAQFARDQFPGLPRAK